ncbi:MAG: hypothetical protein QW292_04240 [Candidatus Parvarchaeota archaeon]
MVKTLGYKNLERKNSVIFLLTVDNDGFPHVALLSPYQVVAVDENRLLIAVQKGTRSQMYLKEKMRGTLILQLKPAVYYVEFEASPAPNWGEYKKEALYSCSVRNVLEDYSSKAPFISELKFYHEEIYKDYTAGFDDIRKYVLSS